MRVDSPGERDLDHRLTLDRGLGMDWFGLSSCGPPPFVWGEKLRQDWPVHTWAASALCSLLAPNTNPTQTTPTPPPTARRKKHSNS